jgi:hypothetical protein
MLSVAFRNRGFGARRKQGTCRFLALAILRVDAELGWVTGDMSDAELREVEQRVAEALRTAPVPWRGWLETRGATAGTSFIEVGGDPELDVEIYVDLHVGARAPGLSSLAQLCAVGG